MVKPTNHDRMLRRTVYVCSVVALLYILHVQLSYGAHIRINSILKMDIRWQLLDLLLPFLFLAFPMLFIKRRIYSLFFSCVIVTVLSIINHYVVEFHGMPFLASDFYNIKTALNVAGEYQFRVDKIVLRLLLLFLAESILIVLAESVDKKRLIDAFGRSVVGIALGAILVILWVVFFSKWTLFPESLIKWSWTEPMNHYGYEVCFLNSLHTSPQMYVVPEGYSGEKLALSLEIAGNSEEKKTDYPDIIIILNESLCDLDYYSDIREGKTALEDIMEIPGIHSGYSTVSQIGGGTNNSEYELLTSNSMAGLTVAAPFNILDMRGANSIVSYLSALGYTSVGMHCEKATNYSRNRAYPALGFDKVYLGAQTFTYGENGNRPWLDSDNYLDLIREYESLGDGPRFIYLLTFQNHGGYEQNDEEQDTISIAENYGDLTDDINEYLSSIQLSSKAFCQLIDYFSKTGRPVLVLMVGDHAPAFIAGIKPKVPLDEIEKSIAEKTVPYFVWTNLATAEAHFSPRTSMVDLVPQLLAASGIPLSVYYQTILRLNGVLCVRTADGYVVDETGSVVPAEGDKEYSELLSMYYWMEYNNLLRGDDYLEELFLPQ